MKKFLMLLFLVFMLTFSIDVLAQCSICTRTAQQLGEEPAKGLNAGIIYLAFAPLTIMGYIGYRWYKQNND